MNKSLFKVMLTDEQADAIVKRMEEECDHAIHYSAYVEENAIGIVDYPVRYTKICCAIGTYMSLKMMNIRSDKRRIKEFYARHAERLGIPPKDEWFVPTFE